MSAAPTLRPVSDRALAIDAGTCAVISLLICTAADELFFMTVAIPLLLGLRFGLWTRLRLEERGPVAVEIILVAICTLFGAFNDWNSVVHHRIYDYAVPHYFAFSTIPIWMLLFWGQILRALITFFHWQRLGDPAPRDEVGLGKRIQHSPWLKLGLQLLIVLVTRQLIYRNFDQPLLSFVPFALGLGLWLLLFRPNRRSLILLATFAVLGPVIEILYIRIGGLHAYRHGILAGVPIWIAIWWLLAVMIWDDLSARLQRLLLRLAAPGDYAVTELSRVDVE